MKVTEYPNTDFALRHFMRDVIVLLGGKVEIADKLDKSQDGVTEKDVNEVRNYACELITSTKTRLVSLHKMKVQVEPSESDE